jgi:hypothetical protein
MKPLDKDRIPNSSWPTHDPMYSARMSIQVEYKSISERVIHKLGHRYISAKCLKTVMQISLHHKSTLKPPRIK